LYVHGHNPSVERVKVARPRLPIIQIPGHTPGTPGLPGRVYDTSTMPPCKQNLFHPCTLPLAYVASRKPVFVAVISSAPSRVVTASGVK